MELVSVLQRFWDQIGHSKNCIEWSSQLMIDACQEHRLCFIGSFCMIFELFNLHLVPLGIFDGSIDRIRQIVNFVPKKARSFAFKMWSGRIDQMVLSKVSRNLRK